MEMNMTLHLPRDAASVPVTASRVRVGAIAVTSDPVPEFAEHGRGLKIIDAVAGNLRLTGNDRQGTIVHFEKTLEWLPRSTRAAPDQHR
jgi:hypothetical protein